MRFWIKLLLGIVIGVSATVYIVKVNAGGWEAAKRNIAARHDAQTKGSAKDLGTAEQGGIPKENDHGPVFVWAGWAFMYSSALFESKDWFASVIRNKDMKESTGIQWERVCLFGPMIIAAAVGLARWEWIRRARKHTL